MKKNILLIALAVLALSCGQNKYDSAERVEMMSQVFDAEAVSAAPQEQQINVSTQENTADKKKIIREGSMGIRVGDIQKSKSIITSLVDKHGGYYAADNYNDVGSELYYDLSIRIPSANYDSFISEVESGGGKVLYKSINARDVSEEYFDINTRLDNKRAYLERYKELLKRAGTIKDILDVEQQVRVLEEEIESAEGRLRYLNDRISYSTLDLRLSQYQEYTPSPGENFWSRFKSSLVTGWKVFVDFVLLLIKIWPLWLIAAVIIIVWRRSVIRKKRK